MVDPPALTPKSIDDLFVVWQIVGPEIIRLGLQQASEAQLRTARAAFDELDDAASTAGGAPAALDIEVVNGTFELLAEATGNTYLISMFHRLMGDMSRIRTLLLTAGDTASPFLAEQHWVRNILTERDADKAATHAKRYLKDVHQRVLQAVVRCRR